jgi:hypothetical protein
MTGHGYLLIVVAVLVLARVLYIVVRRRAGDHCVG